MDVEVLRPTLESIMSKLGIPLCIHGETNGFVMMRKSLCQFMNHCFALS